MFSISAVIPVFRDACRAEVTIEALLKSAQSRNICIEVIIVDDASGDGTEKRLSARFPQCRVVANEFNRGRSASRNIGAAIARGDLLLFLDCDCTPVSDDFLAEHLRTISTGADCSAGNIVGLGSGFWHDYQALAIVKRKSRAAGSAATFTSQNFVVRRSSFIDIGGFNEAYRGYGFEDRDLALRLTANGKIVEVCSAAIATHCDDLQLHKVCSKMQEAGCINSALFRKDHPDSYRQLGYRSIDSHYHPHISALLRPAEPLRNFLIGHCEPMLLSRWIPLFSKVILVRTLVALSYMQGTRCSRNN